MRTTIFLVILLSLLSFKNSASAQADTSLLGMAGDNLDLYATLNLFQNSKTIDEFERALNDKEKAINNLDLNLDEKVDFIRVLTEQEGDNFTFILQVDVNENEKQDVAVILVNKISNTKVNLQIIGDEELYGKNYIVEPKSEEVAVSNASAKQKGNTSSNTVIIVEKVPVIRYVYSPVYTPYYSPYYYGYYPYYYHPWVAIPVNTYRGYYYPYRVHYGYCHGTVIVNHHHYYNNYYHRRHYSNLVIHYNNDYRYGSRSGNGNNHVSNGNRSGESQLNPGYETGKRPSQGNQASANRPAQHPSQGNQTSAKQPSQRPSQGNQASANRPTQRPSQGNQASANRPAQRPSQGNQASANRPAQRPSQGNQASANSSSQQVKENKSNSKPSQSANTPKAVSSSKNTGQRAPRG